MSADWLVQGVLTKIGDTFDRLLGRGWKPSSSLATSELAERLKALVDAEARETSDKRKFVPHNITLKMQWDKFSTDSDDSLKKLETELLTALVDHINDRRYYTYAPISLAVKPDYFTNGVKLFASFDKTAEDESEVSVDVTVPNLKVEVPESQSLPAASLSGIRLATRFEIAGNPIEKVLSINAGQRISVGRTRESDLALDDPSVSKMHASLLLNTDGQLMVADTGSTNGTFVDGERIAYGKGIVFSPSQKLRFGTVNVEMEVVERLEPETTEETVQSAVKTETYAVGEFEFTKKHSEDIVAGRPPAPTAPSLPPPDLTVLKPIVAEPAAEQQNGLEGLEKEVSPSK